jgi:hypothetical protein
MLGFLAACSDMTPMERNKVLAAQQQQSSRRPGDPIDPTANGLEAPENRFTRELQKSAQEYRMAANQAQGADRERYLQMAENLETQARASKSRKW